MRFHRLSGVFTIFFLCWASSAAAQGWGREWMERLSGPGPFEGIGLQFPVACQWNASDRQRFVWSFQTPIAQTPGKNESDPLQGTLVDDKSTRFFCIDFQYTSATNKDREDLGLISLRAIEGRVGFPLERWPDRFPFLAAFEPSVALGAVRFLGADFGEWRLTLSPEIVVKPLKFIPIEKVNIKKERANKKNDWRGLIEFAYGAILITPKITNEDLHVVNREPFEHGWLKRAVWIRVNASELFGLR